MLVDAEPVAPSILVNRASIKREIYMRPAVALRIVTAVVCLGWATALHAQSASSAATVVTAVPRLMWFSGAYQPTDGSPTAPMESVTLSVYRDEKGGQAIWHERQDVVVAANGRFSVLVGSNTPDGMPADLFTSGEPRWLGVLVDRPHEHEQPRLQLVS